MSEEEQQKQEFLEYLQKCLTDASYQIDAWRFEAVIEGIRDRFEAIYGE